MKNSQKSLQKIMNEVWVETENERIKSICDEVSHEIFKDIVEGYRCRNGEDEAWNYLINEIEPVYLSTMLFEKFRIKPETGGNM